MEWDSTVYVSDASDVGFGVRRRVLPADLVGSWGRQSETWRFRREAAIAAREHALKDPLSIDEETLRLRPDSVPDFPPADFFEIGRDALEFGDWRFVFRRAWADRPNILRGEGHALTWALRRKLRDHRCFGRRHLFLVDNLPLALGVTKGRAASSHLSPVTRCICAHVLATGSRVYCRWIPSEFNPADPDSRLEPGPCIERPYAAASVLSGHRETEATAPPCPRKPGRPRKGERM